MKTSGMVKIRFTRTAMAAIFAACAVLIIARPVLYAPPSSGAGDGSKSDEVKIKVDLSVSEKKVHTGDLFEVVAAFEVTEGVHVYRNPKCFQWDELKGARVVGVIWPTEDEMEYETDAGTDTQPLAFEGVDGKFKLRQVLRAVAKPGESIILKGKLHFQGCDVVCYLPETRDIDFKLTALPPAPGANGNGASAETSKPGTKPVSGSVSEGVFEGGTFRWIDLILAFGIGVVMSLTPCVLPLTPITSGIITSYARPGKVNALIASLIYVLGLSIVFGLLGLVVGIVGGAAQSVINSVYVRAVIAAIFIVLSLSMFGLFEIRMPNSVTSRAHNAGQKTRKNFLGLFALGMVSAFIISPCIAGPVLATLAYITTTGDYARGFLTMFVLAWGMGVLLIIAGTFPSFLPRNGSWMERSKVIFGFLMLWGALYFISPYIPEGVYYIGIALLAVFGSAFLHCWDSIKPDSGLWSRIGRAVGIILILIAVLFGYNGVAQLTGLKLGEAGEKAENVAKNGQAGTIIEGTKTDVDAALASGKPVMLDFSAPWCVMCKELDGTTFANPAVLEELKRFKAIKVNFDNEKELVEKYKAIGPPLVILFDSSGEVVRKLDYDDVKNSDEFLEILKRVE